MDGDRLAKRIERLLVTVLASLSKAWGGRGQILMEKSMTYLLLRNLSISMASKGLPSYVVLPTLLAALFF